MNETRKVTRAAGIIGMATLLSRIAGFIRDMVIAWFFGAGWIADAFFVAFRIPNLLRRLFAEGSLSIAFVPVFAHYLTHKGKPCAFEMAQSAIRLLSMILVASTLMGILFAPGIIRVIAPGYDGQQFILTVTLTRIMFPYIFFICLVALCMGILNVLGHFAAPAAAPILLNLSMIGAVLFISPRLEVPVFGLAGGVLAGGALQLLLQIPFLLKKGFYLTRNVPLVHPGVKKVAKLMGPAVFGAAVYQINIFVITLLATLLPEGSVSYLYYADRLVQFPLGIFAISISVAILPSLSRQAAAKDIPALSATFAYAMRMVFFITLPAMAGLVVLSRPIVSLLFQRGAFDAQSTAFTADALVYYALGLWAFSGVRIVVSTFYALQDTKTPVKMGLVSIMANILLAMALMSPLKHSGLALATSLAAAINLLLLGRVLMHKLDAGILKKMIESILRSVVCTAIMGVCLWGAMGLFPLSQQASGRMRLIQVAGGILFGMAAYIALALALRCRELNEITGILKKGKPE